ncbi:SRPBCC family protein [Nonomuraea angiospora]|uniref:Membrane protein n=1 Tax=Nonomuraea angiospora TaxID=46172 RepID=A0ABR9LS62_9ACTN|nr:SRPBCC family protein [Nonomuraea angiospora]MBE1583505.1 putative membrane protein [Nonomuraea angiospora]
MAQESKAGPVQKAAQEVLPKDLLMEGAQKLVQALVERALSSLTDRLEGMTGRLTDFAEGGGGGGLLSAITGSEGVSPGKILGKSLLSGAGTAVKETIKGLGKKGKRAGKVRVVNIVEWIDVGAPIRIVYNTWTQFESFPGYMKKVENVDQASDEKVNWKAQIFWSHRTWESHIIEQVPDQRIIWRSKGPKGFVDGAVTFHAVTPDLTRILLVLEYHPQGMFEHVGNIWRAQGRRARLEFKHFRRHVMTQTMLHPEEAEEDGWRGVIHDSKVVKTHEEAVEEEQAEAEGRAEEEEERPEEGKAEEPAEEEREEEPEGEYEEEEEPEEEYEEEPEEEEEEEEERTRAETGKGQGARRPARRRPAEEEEEEEEEPRRPVRRRVATRRG